MGVNMEKVKAVMKAKEEKKGTLNKKIFLKISTKCKKLYIMVL